MPSIGSHTGILRLRQFIRDNRGQDLAEYGLLVAAVGLLVLGGTASLGTNLQTWLAAVAAKLVAVTP